ncbi:MAG: methionyl-tRNA formyltransferase [Verrucomicrobia bacterium]|nr:methionyl-tRNA formyltransferase [Verrucomicrobiota bacterium]
MDPLRCIFMGTAELACASLEALAKEPSLQLLAVVTQPDKPRGRDLKLLPTHVKQTAQRLNLQVLQPARARDESFLKSIEELRPDLIVVVAYGQILPQRLLDIPRHGCLNVHTSLLPRWRGAAPIQWALLEGDRETGVTIMRMDAGLDTGPILSRQITPVADDDNAQTLHDRLAQLGASLLVRTIPEFVSGKLTPQPQPSEGVTHARKISKEDGRLDWTQPARVLWNRVRAFTPWPSAYTFIPLDGKPRLLKVWQAALEDKLSGPPGTVLVAGRDGLIIACGAGALRLLSVQLEGSRRMSVAEFLAGHPLAPGLSLKTNS